MIDNIHYIVENIYHSKIIVELTYKILKITQIVYQK